MPSISRTSLFRFAVAAVALTLCFAQPLVELVWFALGSSLFSHILLIPLVSLYLIRQQKDALCRSLSGPQGRLQNSLTHSRSHRMGAAMSGIALPGIGTPGHPLTPALSPSEGERVPEGPVRGIGTGERARGSAVDDGADQPGDSRAPQRPSPWAIVPVLSGVGLLAVYWIVWRAGSALPVTDYLAVMTTAYLLLLLGVAWACLGTAVMRAWAFPIAFLAFMIPWPTGMIEGVEVGLQYASAEVAAVLLNLTGTPFLRDGRVFALPGITIQVAPECSGIRSSYVLLITSVLAAHVLLRTRWKQWVLGLIVVPLGILRNGCRILTISLLCVHVSPEMIDSPLHHRGGPVFFVLSLVPLFLVLLWLRRSEPR